MADVTLKIISIKTLPEFIDLIRKENKTVILVGGVFDILHTGHIEFLRKASSLADTLLVMLESDAAVARKKGPDRPVHSQLDRAQVLASIPEVRGIILVPEFERDEQYFELVKDIRPDIIGVTQGDSRKHVDMQASVIGAEVVVVMEKIEGHSTTRLISEITNL